jgi:hypothetical protein
VSGPVDCTIDPALDWTGPISECSDLPVKFLYDLVQVTCGRGRGGPVRPGSRRLVMQLCFPEHETQPGPFLRHMPSRPIQFLIFFAHSGQEFFRFLRICCGKLISLAAIIRSLHRQFTFETIEMFSNGSFSRSGSSALVSAIPTTGQEIWKRLPRHHDCFPYDRKISFAGQESVPAPSGGPVIPDAAEEVKG